MFLSNDISTQMDLSSLLPQIVDRVRIPVIAAGGFAMLAVLMLPWRWVRQLCRSARLICCVTKRIPRHFIVLS